MRRSLVPALLTVLALVAVACSDGDDKPAPTTVARPRGTELVIGYLGQETGGVLASGTPATEGRDALAAWARWTNDAGGIAGHPVRIAVRDGGNEPAATLAAANELVDTDGALAIVGQQDTCCMAAWAEQVAGKGVAIIGGQSQTIAPLANPLVFAQATSVLSQVYGQLAKVKTAGKTRFGNLYCTEQPSCGQVNDLLRSAAPKAGVVFAYDKAATADQDFTAACLAAKEAAVEVLQLDGVSVDRVTRDCSRQQFTPTYGIVGDAKAQLEVPELDGALGTLPAFPAFFVGPETKDFRAAMRRYAPSLAPTVVSSEAWLAGLAFRLAVERADVASPTRADVVRGLLTFQGETLGGLAPPLSYGPAGQRNPAQRCYYLFTIEGGNYVASQGLKPECEPA